MLGRGCPPLGGSGSRLPGSSGQMTQKGDLRREGHGPSQPTRLPSWPPPPPAPQLSRPWGWTALLVARLSPLVCMDLSLWMVSPRLKCLDPVDTQMSPKSVLSSRTLLRTSAYKSSCQKPCPNSICLCLKLPNLRVRPFSRQFVRLSDALSGEETPFASGTTRKCSYCCPCLLHHFSHVQLFATPWTVAHEFPRPGDSPGKNTGVK